MQTTIDTVTYKLPTDLDAQVTKELSAWQTDNKVKRLWERDASVWTGADESKWLDWLDITAKQLARVAELTALAQEVKTRGFKHVLLLGMGGSSLCPEVMSKTFGHKSGFPDLQILDSTDPAQIRALDKSVDLSKTLCIVSSKSGSTLEPNIFKQYFFTRMVETVGAEKAPSHFIAVTDPGSKMQHVAESAKFWHIYYGLPGIGGRYSALSDFGMVPAAAMGVDVEKFLQNTQKMVDACSAAVSASKNPGVVLGAIMGVLARNGRDKVTLFASPGIGDLGAWLEQLLAESTGKIGKGLIPVDREQRGTVTVYGDDRLFVYLRLATNPDADQDKFITEMEASGQPVVRISVPDVYHIGQEFFRWEIATAVAGSIIGINAFNQPDVEASKVVTRDLTTAYETTGSLPAESPIYEGEGIKLFTDEKNAAELAKLVGPEKSLVAYLKAHLGRIGKGDYFASLGYIHMTREHEDLLQKARTAVRDKKKVATCLGFGPRFLHSTGQAYKGGPNSGVFLQITCDDANDLAVPEQKYTFGVVKAAQARGDFQVLAERGRRALRIHVGSDVKSGLNTVAQAIDRALT